MANPQQIIANLQSNPRLLAIVGGTVVLVIVLVIVLMANSGGNSTEGCPEGKIEEKDMLLAQAPNIGVALEIQSLLARQGINASRVDADGGKANILLQKEATYCHRDQALITLVSSGLMDRNIGLESFDKGDLTASREEKRIKLVRAMQGELSRVIKRLDKVNDATVQLSIPEPTIFRSQQEKISASVQVVLDNGERLTRNEVRAISNLMVGAVQGLDVHHVAISDTNGNTYNSVLDSGAELDDRIAEQDQYMRDKVSQQLDKLVGRGNYVVTVSTFLREAPQETMIKRYEPDTSAVASRQEFAENLQSESANGGLTGGAVGSAISQNLRTIGSSGRSERGYKRTGQEVRYNNTETQTLTTSLPGMIEDITIAVTIDEDHYPTVVDGRGVDTRMDEGDLRELIAHAASPKARASNVSIVATQLGGKLGALGAASVGGAGPITSAGGLGGSGDYSWIWWMAGSIGVFILVLAIIMSRGGSAKPVGPDETTIQEIQRLHEITNQQQQAIMAAQQQTQMLMEAQQRQMAGGGEPALTGAGDMPVGQITTAQTVIPQEPAAPRVDLAQALQDVKTALDDEDLDEEDMELQIRNWIESS